MVPAGRGRRRRGWIGVWVAAVAAGCSGAWAAEAPKVSHGLHRANLHVHTRYSRPDSWATLKYREEALPDNFIAVDSGATLRAARALGLDCVGLSDHAECIGSTLRHESAWATEQIDARHATKRGFVALRGFEWTGPGYFHANVFGTEGYCGDRELKSGYQGATAGDLAAFYAWVEAERTRVGAEGQPVKPVVQINHPWLWKGAKTPLDPPARAEVHLLEVGGGMYLPEVATKDTPIWAHHTIRPRGEQWYRTALKNGWHVAPTVGHDNFTVPSSVTRRFHTGIWAKESTQEALLEALRGRRTFAADDKEMRLWLTAQAGGRWYLMGDTVYTGGNDLALYASSSDTSGTFATSLLDMEGKPVLQFDGREKVCNKRMMLTADQITQLPQNPAGERPVYLALERTGKGTGVAISAPLWLSTLAAPAGAGMAEEPTCRAGPQR